jgi:hypothetical protein
MRRTSIDLCSTLLVLGALCLPGRAARAQASPRPPSVPPALAPSPQDAPASFRTQLGEAAGAAYPGAPTTYAPMVVPLGPKELAYKDGDPIPYGYHVEGKVQITYLTSGLATFIASFSMGMLLSSASNVTNDDVAAVPFAGPFIAASTLTTRHKADFGNSDVSRINRVGMVVIGIGEAVGGALIAAAFAAGGEKLVRTEPKLRPSVAPIVGSGFAGVGVSGAL